MIVPNERYTFSSRSGRQSRGTHRTGHRLSLLVVLVLVLVAAGIGFWRREAIVGWFAAEEEDGPELRELWDEQEYDLIVERTQALLDESPLDTTVLMYNGFSRFYLSTESFTLEEKLPQVNASIIALRKALLRANPDIAPGIEYVLGKAYYFKGRYYLDLSIAYLERALEHGYRAHDMYDFLGVAYSDLGFYDTSAEYFAQAIELEATDMRYLALSQAYMNADRTEEAEAYLLRTINKTNDPVVEQKSRFLLGKLYFDAGQLTKAEDQYRGILEVNPRSADAYYYLGEIFLSYDKPIEARAQWREALIIDPSHYGARLRYYK